MTHTKQQTISKETLMEIAVWEMKREWEVKILCTTYWLSPQKVEKKKERSEPDLLNLASEMCLCVCVYI